MLLSKVVGQKSIKEVLINSVKTDKISHAQLFVGNEGYGALPLVIAYAQFILCNSKTNDDSCGTCSSCIKFKNLSHPDLHFSFPIQLSANARTADTALDIFKNTIKNNAYLTEQEWYSILGNEDKQGVIGKDESQQILKKLQLKSYEGGYKIMIVWLAEKMNTAAANKLLKLIEEPPKKTIFLLVAKSVNQIMPTIISRTQITQLPKLAEQDIIEYLENRNVNSNQANELASFSNGDLSVALKNIDEDENQENFNLFVEWMRICFSRDVVKATNFSNTVASLGREAQKNFLLFSLNIIQQSLRGNFLEHTHIKTTPNQKQFIVKFMPFIHIKNALKVHNLITEAHYHIDRNANPKILFLNLSFNLFKLIKR